MNIEGIQLLNTLPMTWPENAKAPSAADGTFQEIMLDSIRAINDQQIEVNEGIKDFLKGDGMSVHEIMLKSEEAKLSLEFAVQMRNKVLEAYNEIMRMQM